MTDEMQEPGAPYRPNELPRDRAVFIGTLIQRFKPIQGESPQAGQYQGTFSYFQDEITDGSRVMEALIAEANAVKPDSVKADIEKTGKYVTITMAPSSYQAFIDYAKLKRDQLLGRTGGHERSA